MTRPKTGLVRKDSDRSRRRFEGGTIDRIERMKAELELATLRSELAKAEVELAVVRQQIDQRRIK